MLLGLAESALRLQRPEAAACHVDEAVGLFESMDATALVESADLLRQRVEAMTA